jgi:uracil-DNA glycosylase
MTIPQPALTREIEAALEWWRAAGVDSDFCDDAICWLSDPVEVTAQSSMPRQPTRASAPSPPLEESPQTTSINSTDYLGESPPQTIEDFRQWWLDSPAFGAKGLYPRVAPRGAEKAQLMVVVPYPEQGDQQRLLSGPQGRLLDNILKAAGVAENDVYIASVLPVHTPMADLASLAQSGLEKVLLHHVNLVTPQRLLVFGIGLSSMLGKELTNRNNLLREINQFTPSPPTLISEDLDSLLELPRLKARFWRRWIQWSATSQSEQ